MKEILYEMTLQGRKLERTVVVDANGKTFSVKYESLVIAKRQAWVTVKTFVRDRVKWAVVVPKRLVTLRENQWDSLNWDAADEESLKLAIRILDGT